MGNVYFIWFFGNGYFKIIVLLSGEKEIFEYLNTHMNDILNIDKTACEHIANQNRK